MCPRVPQREYECANGHRLGRDCVRSISLPELSSVAEEYSMLTRLGWVVVPHTGAFVFCSDECWRNSAAANLRTWPLISEER